VTCNDAAAIFEREARTGDTRRSDGEPKSLQHRQMKRIAATLRAHGDEERFDDDTARLLPSLNAATLLVLEMLMMQWWPQP
jgi:hypothetical protein